MKKNYISFTIVHLLKVKKIEVKSEEVRQRRNVRLWVVTPANNSFRCSFLRGQEDRNFKFASQLRRSTGAQNAVDDRPTESFFAWIA